MQNKIEEYVEEYRKYIQYICRKRKQGLKDQIEDMESFIVLELITIYKKKYKYDDFDWVTRTIIRRKAIDFTANFYKRNEDLIFENQALGSDGNVRSSLTEGGDSQTINKHFVTKAISKNKEDNRNNQILEVVRDIERKINNDLYKNDFSDWSREFIEVVIELYEYGYDCERDDIMECMGYELNEVAKFNSKLLAFRNKLKEIFGLDSTTF